MRRAARGGRIVAVGTTACGCWKAPPTQTGDHHAFDGETAIFITPGYRFRAVDVLLTNFHLPRSTLFMLVSAFAGWSRSARLRPCDRSGLSLLQLWRCLSALSRAESGAPDRRRERVP